jgi:hypothetical protein
MGFYSLYERHPPGNEFTGASWWEHIYTHLSHLPQIDKGLIFRYINVISEKKYGNKKTKTK